MTSISLAEVPRGSLFPCLLAYLEQCLLRNQQMKRSTDKYYSVLLYSSCESGKGAMKKHETKRWTSKNLRTSSAESSCLLWQPSCIGRCALLGSPEFGLRHILPSNTIQVVQSLTQELTFFFKVPRHGSRCFRWSCTGHSRSFGWTAPLAKLKSCSTPTQSVHHESRGETIEKTIVGESCCKRSQMNRDLKLKRLQREFQSAEIGKLQRSARRSTVEVVPPEEDFAARIFVECCATTRLCLDVLVTLVKLRIFTWTHLAQKLREIGLCQIAVECTWGFWVFMWNFVKSKSILLYFVYVHLSDAIRAATKNIVEGIPFANCWKTCDLICTFKRLMAGMSTVANAGPMPKLSSLKNVCCLNLQKYLSSEVLTLR